MKEASHCSFFLVTKSVRLSSPNYKFIDKKKYPKLSVILVVRINNLQTTGCYMLTTVNNYLLTSMF